MGLANVVGILQNLV